MIVPTVFANARARESLQEDNKLLSQALISIVHLSRRYSVPANTSPELMKSALLQVAAQACKALRGEQ